VPRLVALAVALLTGCSTSVETSRVEAVPEPTSATGYYSPEQAARGEQAFRQACGACHPTSEFHGRDFEWRWRRQTVWDLYRETTRTMPEDDPGGLADRSYADIIAYILQINDYPIGDTELIPTEEIMDTIPLGPGAVRQQSQEGGEK
jgi:mono/diheme cytochrome c family protein